MGRDNAGKLEGREIVKDGAARMAAAKADGGSEAIGFRFCQTFYGDCNRGHRDQA